MIMRKLMRVVAFVCISSLLSIAVAAESDLLFETPLMDLDGQPATLAGYRGKPLIVNFWARICYPCREELPALDILNEQYRDELAVVALAVEDQPESVREFANAYQLDLPIVLGKDAGIDLMQTLGNKIAGLPYTVVIDRHGVIVLKKMGALSPEEIEGILKTVLPDSATK